MRLLVVGASLACFAGAVPAEGFEDIVRRQKSGMWEITQPGSTGKGAPGSFCVTNQHKIDSRQSLSRALGGNCKTLRDTLNGDRFDLQIQCVLGSPDTKPTGTVLMTMRGTATPTDIQFTFTPQISGDHPRFKQLGEFLRKEQAERWRWIRDCRVGEYAGQQ